MKVSILHIYPLGFLTRYLKGRRMVHIKEIYPLVQFYYPKFPKKYLRQIILELVELNFLKRINRDEFEVLSAIRCMGKKKFIEVVIDKKNNKEQIRKVSLIEITDSYNENFPFF